PSALRMLAIAVDPFMACAPARVRRRVDLPGMAAASARRHGLQQRLWIADDPSTDHVDELARVAYVGRGIGVEDYQIGEFARFDTANVLVLFQRPGVVNRRRLQRGDGC